MKANSLILLCLSALTSGACGGSSAGSAAGDSAAQSDVCAGDTSDFHAGISETGANQYAVQVMDAEPAVPAESPQENTWRFKITGPSGAPVDGATLDVRCAMPGHTHGCGATPHVAGETGGEYEVSSLYFTMQKHWDVTVNVTDGTATDKVTFGLCIH